MVDNDERAGTCAASNTKILLPVTASLVPMTTSPVALLQSIPNNAAREMVSDMRARPGMGTLKTAEELRIRPHRKSQRSGRQ